MKKSPLVHVHFLFSCSRSIKTPSLFLSLSPSLSFSLSLIRLFTSKNKINFKNSMKMTNWADIMGSDSGDVNVIYNKFLDTLNKNFDENFPKVKLSIRGSKDKNWMTSGLRTSCMHKNKLYKQWLTTKSPDDEIKYKIFKKAHANAIKARQKEYYYELFNNRSMKLKDIWKEVNKLCSCGKKNNTTTVIDKLIVNNKIITNKQEISDQMNKYYCNVGTNISTSIPNNHISYKKYMPTPLSSTIFMEPVTKQEILTIINKLNINKGPGPDGIHTKLITEVAEEIILPLEHIYNMSILTGVVPSELKIARVIPIYKKGEKSDCSNYRPISMLNIFNKILEKLVFTRVISFLNKNKIIYNNQFGFRSNHSTSQALINVLDRVYESMAVWKYER